MGVTDGSIIAAIITAHMRRNDADACSQVCPGMRIHVIDIDPPPGIGISLIDDMDRHQRIVSAALRRKSSAETPQNARCEARPEPAQHGGARAINRVTFYSSTFCQVACATPTIFSHRGSGEVSAA